MGDVPGKGLTGKYSATLEKCTEDCNGRNDCNSFEYSTKLSQCKLLSEKDPTGPKCGDFHFCAKKIETCTGSSLVISSNLHNFNEMNQNNLQKFNSFMVYL